ncbi:hypothetical protein T484DRAFT_1889709 [Baffinella frigidus]|nr:hypothetical protein T484DRAFT_1889709 [Cryptophyta sp. CCMP2293]
MASSHTVSTTLSPSSSPSPASSLGRADFARLLPRLPSEGMLLTRVRATHMISVLGKEASAEALAKMANTTVESLEADLGPEFVMSLRVASSSQKGGEWI